MAKNREWTRILDAFTMDRAGWRIVVRPIPRGGWEALLYDADLADAALAIGEDPDDEDGKLADTEADAKLLAEEMLERQIKGGPPASRFSKA
jgi:hypothetical protein